MAKMWAVEVYPMRVQQMSMDRVRCEWEMGYHNLGYLQCQDGWRRGAWFTQPLFGMFEGRRGKECLGWHS